jgi:hypothetical protein
MMKLFQLAIAAAVGAVFIYVGESSGNPINPLIIAGNMIAIPYGATLFLLWLRRRFSAKEHSGDGCDV